MGAWACFPILCCHADLMEVMVQMGEIVRRQEAQSDGFSGPDSTRFVQLRRWDVRDEMGKIAVVGCP